ncbi:Uncharacterized protein L484_014460 [Morus notabilis]|uniref:Mitochondrial glycoprotein n=1 Tax=Morus notabilis TaxID=981085 RepID=W9QJN7_9ROSA|nr:uncharacterized protein At2g39795, mitochondrial [Morus notabilis]EXB38645.1 Uncharacterized protein L484_014460 [Morus notabilis]
MARLLRDSQNARRIFSPSSETQCRSFLRKSSLPFLSRKAMSTTPEALEETLPKSPLAANIVRILRNEIQHLSEYTPAHEPVTEYKSFSVQDRPGEQWMTMRRKFGNGEDIKIEATMFDGYELSPKLGDDNVGEDLRLHISLLVDISKGNGSEDLEFVCSAWPDSLEVQNVYLLRRDRMLARPYMGPDIRKLNEDFRKAVHEFLGVRGIDDELSVFLHDYMMNKDRIELIQWLRNVKSYVKKIG